MNGFWTSDIGVMPTPGRLTVLGRIDDVLNLGGIKILPTPIEDFIRTLFDVTDAVLIGADTSTGGSKLHVFVERTDPALDPMIKGLIPPLLVG